MPAMVPVVLLSIASGPAAAINCTPDDITLTTQLEVNNFQINHGPCDHVVGSLTITGLDVMNLDGLSGIVSVGQGASGFLILEDAPNLVNLDGLSSLSAVAGTLIIFNCDALVNVDGLSGLQSLGGSLNLTNNEGLSNINGLSNLESVGSGLFVGENPALMNIDGLVSLDAVGSSIRFERNTLLQNLDGLTGLSAVPHDLGVLDNYSLVHLDGLSNFTHVGNSVEIRNNYLLEDLGLGGLSEVGGDFTIGGNHSLTSLGDQQSLISVGGFVSVSGNSNLVDCMALTRLLDDIDHGAPGPGPGPGGIPDVGQDATFALNLFGCNSILEVMTIAKSGFEGPFNTLTVLDNELFPASGGRIAIGADSFPVIAYTYTDLIPGTSELRVAKCQDVACTAASIETLTDLGEFEAGSASIALGNDALPAIAYFDPSTDSLKVIHCNDGACTGGDETLSTVDAPITVGGGISLTIGQDGFPVMSYRDQSALKLRIAKCNDVACSGGDETLTTLNNAGGNRSSIAIGSDGFPVISYVETVTPFEGDLQVVKCNDPACSGQDETISFVDDAASVVVASSDIAVPADGFPVIAYVALAGGAVSVAKCNDPACAGGDETIVAIDPELSRHPLVTIGLDGFPLVAYTRTAGSPLVAVKCGDGTCTGNRTSAIVDDEYQFTATDVAIGDDGLPFISYNDRSERSLKVAHCESVSCQPN